LLALARCLCADPSLILLDEPTEGIQPSIIEEIVETLQVVKKRRELSIVLVEQNLDFIAGAFPTQRKTRSMPGTSRQRYAELPMGRYAASASRSRTLFALPACR
jgi:ABC-type phosphate/phosphonate transport system ATPase subunit